MAEHEDRRNLQNRPHWGAVFGTSFAVLWLLFLVVALTAGGCQSDQREGAEKLRYCNLSLTLGTPFDVFQIERAKRSKVRLEQGIAYSQMGEVDQAKQAFRAALMGAQEGGESWVRELHRRMLPLEDKRARDMWVSVLMEDASE